MSQNSEDRLLKLGKYVGIPILILLFCLIMFRLLFVTFVDNYEFAYSYDMTTGEMKSVDRQGYIVASPFTRIHTIDMRPTQVTINANSRVLNAKLVQFDTTGWRLFVSWHGRDDYSNDGTELNPGNLNKILMSYAYDGSGKSYPFLTVLRELKPDDVVDSTSAHAVISQPTDSILVADTTSK